MKKLKSLKLISEADVQEMIASDLDSPELTEADFAAMCPFAEALPDLAAKMKKGRIRLPRKKPHQ